MSRPYKQYSISGVSAVLAYLAVSPTSPKPLSIFDDGNTLSHDRLVDLLRHALRAVGLDTSQYSFRIGAATAAARAGIQDLFIQNLGHWKSHLTYEPPYNCFSHPLKYANWTLIMSYL